MSRYKIKTHRYNSAGEIWEVFVGESSPADVIRHAALKTSEDCANWIAGYVSACEYTKDLHKEDRDRVAAAMQECMEVGIMANHVHAHEHCWERIPGSADTFECIGCGDRTGGETAGVVWRWELHEGRYFADLAKDQPSNSFRIVVKPTLEEAQEWVEYNNPGGLLYDEGCLGCDWEGGPHDEDCPVRAEEEDRRAHALFQELSPKNPPQLPERARALFRKLFGA